MALTTGDVNKQLWDEELMRLMSLAAATVKRNNDLENQVADLRSELAMWKRAHTNLREAAKYSANIHDVGLPKGGLCYSPPPVETRPLVLCVINGDSEIFDNPFITQGFQGGQAAAQDLTRGIAEYLTNEGVQITPNNLSFWTTIFCNRASLMSKVLAEQICTENQFLDFLSGFSQASTRFATVDVGTGNDVTDAKIREYLETYTRFPQTMHIFVGGTLNGNYLDTLRSLEAEQLLGKIVLLSGREGDEEPRGLPFISVPILEIKGLFRSLTQQSSPKKPLIVPVNTVTVSTNGGLISPKSPPRATRLIDPSLPLHKQNPPPCNEHYLMNCSKGPALCKYSHDYLLTQEQLACLANNAKKAPCNWLKSGLHCPYGDRCCWGHVCPNGPKCFHLSKGKCWFKGTAMHEVRVSPSLDGLQV